MSFFSGRPRPSSTRIDRHTLSTVEHAAVTASLGSVLMLAGARSRSRVTVLSERSPNVHRYTCLFEQCNLGFGQDSDDIVLHCGWRRANFVPENRGSHPPQLHLWAMRSETTLKTATCIRLPKANAAANSRRVPNSARPYTAMCVTPLKAVPRVQSQGTVCGPNATVVLRSMQLVRFSILPSAGRLPHSRDFNRVSIAILGPRYIRWVRRVPFKC